MPLRSLMLVGVACCACSHGMSQGPGASQLPGPLVAAMPEVIGAGVDLSEPACTIQQAVEGPVTVAGSWGPGGALFGCRTGPSPRMDLVRQLKDDQRIAACLRQRGIGLLVARVQVTASGALARAIVTEVEGGQDAAARCLSLVASHRFVSVGCRWNAEVRWALLQSEP